MKVKTLRHCIHHVFGHILNSAASSKSLSLWLCLEALAVSGDSYWIKKQKRWHEIPFRGKMDGVHCCSRYGVADAIWVCFCCGEFSLQVHRAVESADRQVRGAGHPALLYCGEGVQDAISLCTETLLLPRSSVLPVLAFRVGSILTSETSSVSGSIPQRALHPSRHPPLPPSCSSTSPVEMCFPVKSVLAKPAKTPDTETQVLWAVLQPAGCFLLPPKALCNCRSWAGLGCRLLFHGRQISTAVMLSRFLPHEDFVSLHEIQVWLLSVSSQSLARAPGPASSLPSLSSRVVRG